LMLDEQGKFLLEHHFILDRHQSELELAK
jgi:hypothetical protein